MLIYLCTVKLDINTKKEWESFRIKMSKVEYNDFILFLNERCQILESLSASKSHSINEKSNFQVKGPNKISNKGFSRSSLSYNDKCLICNPDRHWFSKCSKFMSLNASERFNEIKKLHLCLNCFKPNHMSSQCTLSNCNKCGKPHNVLLHIDFLRPEEASKDPKINSNENVLSEK